MNKITKETHPKLFKHYKKNSNKLTKSIYKKLNKLPSSVESYNKLFTEDEINELSGKIRFETVWIDLETGDLIVWDTRLRFFSNKNPFIIYYYDGTPKRMFVGIL
jgi:hypothetical protein